MTDSPVRQSPAADRPSDSAGARSDGARVGVLHHRRRPDAAHRRLAAWLRLGDLAGCLCRPRPRRRWRTGSSGLPRRLDVPVSSPAYFAFTHLVMSQRQQRYGGTARSGRFGVLTVLLVWAWAAGAGPCGGSRPGLFGRVAAGGAVCARQAATPSRFSRCWPGGGRQSRA